MKKKISFILLAILLISGGLFAQQMPHYSQYFLNNFAINPAVAGSSGFSDIRSNHRSQWVGITDAPRTFTLSMNAPVKEQKMGLGGTVFTDITGPTRRIGANFAYSYHLKIAEKTKLAMGLSAGLLQFTIDGSKITVRDPGDNYYVNGLQSVIVPDFGFGIYMYHDKYFFGASVPQITQNQLKSFANEQSRARLEDHYFITGGYVFKANENFQVQPMLMVKYVSPVPVQVDLSARVIYQEKLWVGATFRTRDAFSVMFSFIYQDNLMIGYAYDYTVSGLQKYSSGTHELMLGLRFGTTPEISEPPPVE